MEVAGNGYRRQADGDAAAVRQQIDAAGAANYDPAWNITFGVNNHLVLLTATALFIIYLVASLVLIVWRWRGCLVSMILDDLD